MTLKDMAAAANSFHALAAAVLAAAVASWFMPEYGWSAVFERQSKTRGPRIAKLEKELSELRALDPATAEATEKKAGRTRAATAAARERFKSLGMEELPAGAKAVIDAKRRVDEALVKSNLKIIMSDARARAPEAAQERAEASPGQAAGTVREMTAAEFKRQSDKVASALKGSMRDEFLADSGRKYARMLAAEKKRAEAEAKTKSAAPAAPAPRSAPLFERQTIDYTAEGAFPDVFLFFVGQTREKANHSFRDISARRGENGAAGLSFSLQVNYTKQ